MWKRGIWIARGVGIVLVILGVASSLGLITIYDTMTGMNKDMQTQEEIAWLCHKTTLRITMLAGLPHENNATTNKGPTMSPEMGM